jgi:hypothetical protein
MAARSAAAGDQALGSVFGHLRLSQRGLIRMPPPRKTFLMPGAGYRVVGPCELTAEGYDLLERYP